MGFEKVYKVMEDYPIPFLVPPVLIFVAIDIYASINPFFIVTFSVPTIIFVHFFLVTLKKIFKIERRNRDKQRGVHKYSFPSYHAGMGTCFCTIQSLIFPLTAPIMVALIFVTAIGRVRLDLHDWKEVLSGILFVIPVVFIFYLSISSFFSITQI